MRVTRIEIHFLVHGNQQRVATIKPKSQGGDRVKRIALDSDGPFNDKRPDMISLDGEGDLTDGEGPQLCYTIDRQVVCW